MKRRIINHWTAGNFTPCADDLFHYHFLIDVGGRVIPGVFSVKANDNCKDGEYAAHCGGGNTNRIGIAVCGMKGFVSAKKQGNRKLSKIQIEKLFALNAKMLLDEGWNEATLDNLMTHKEFGDLHPDTSSAGKIDISFLPAYPTIKPDEVGDFIRAKTNWYIKKLQEKRG